MQRLAILNIVGLTESHLGQHTPNLSALAAKSSVSTLNPPLPCVTSTVQSSILTGVQPIEHGIVANGWYERDTKETFFWRQANSLVQGEFIWDALKKENPSATVANICWWFNMYSTVDYAVTPRPHVSSRWQENPRCMDNSL